MGTIITRAKFQGNIKPSIIDRVVVVRCYHKLPIENQQPITMKIYWLPSYCTNFKFEVPLEYEHTHTVQVYGVNDRVVQAEIVAIGE